MGMNIIYHFLDIIKKPTPRCNQIAHATEYAPRIGRLEINTPKINFSQETTISNEL